MGRIEARLFLVPGPKPWLGRNKFVVAVGIVIYCIAAGHPRVAAKYRSRNRFICGQLNNKNKRENYYLPDQEMLKQKKKKKEDIINPLETNTVTLIGNIFKNAICTSNETCLREMIN
jgi:hypothetical protein